MDHWLLRWASFSTGRRVLGRFFVGRVGPLFRWAYWAKHSAERWAERWAKLPDSTWPRLSAGLLYCWTSSLGPPDSGLNFWAGQNHTSPLNQLGHAAPLGLSHSAMGRFFRKLTWTPMFSRNVT
ncbi:hypothetical protein Salat_1592400 [Sesamum alatum]|uniref:Uncharacterized protein n=1 Tax=Sesamum alatum TaxID=300844 RepID=A0AAE1Y5K3_9LAMI|nr:hypothetical protein Salat_1592400 [Sesamum alatum]